MTTAASNPVAVKPTLRNVNINGRRTSVRMERVMWEALDVICAREDISTNEICCLIDQVRGDLGLTASLRVIILSYYVSIARLSIETEVSQIIGTDSQTGDPITPDPSLSKATNEVGLENAFSLVGIEMPR